jgi:hypothetical protein
MRASTRERRNWGSYCCVESPDHLHVAYVRHDASGKETLYVDDRPLGVYAAQEQMSFSPDGKRLAYIAAETVNEDRRLYVDGKLVANTAPRAIAFTFAPDSSRLVYVADRSKGGDRRTAAFIGSLHDVDGRPLLADQTLLIESTVLDRFSFRFSVDGRHLLFAEGPVTTTDAQGLVVHSADYLTIDGRRLLLGTRDRSPQKSALGHAVSFSNDAARICVAQAVSHDDDHITFTERRVLDLEGREVALDYGSVCHLPVIEPSNSPVPFSSVWDNYSIYSGGHRVRAEHAGSLMRIVVDDEPQPVYDIVWEPWFAPDGNEIRYGAVDGDRVLWIRAPLPPVVGPNSHRPTTSRSSEVQTR